MVETVEDKLAKLREWFDQFGSVIVAYSGGVDSALLMTAAHQERGQRALACIGVSPSYPRRERTAAVELAEQIGAELRLVDTAELLDENYRSNPEDRCYHCKNALFDVLGMIAAAEGYEVIVDGTNADDIADYRPGRQAAREHRVRSPLAELGIGKDEVRAMARSLGLPVWDKPAMACLSSRVPPGTVITEELLAQIEAAEDVLADLGFRQFRVRHHGPIARIELPAEDLPKAIELRWTIVERVRGTGYQYVTLDLAGFRAPPRPGRRCQPVPFLSSNSDSQSLM